MPINSEHPDYTQNKDIWEKCIDFYNGEEAVKAAGKKYVPPLSGQTSDKYNAYVNRGPFFGGVSRTVSALAGAIFRKEPSIKLDKSVEYLRKDATGSGMSLTELAIAAVVEILKTGRVGILVDIPEKGGLPYLVLYKSLEIKNWDMESDDHFVVLEENSFKRNEKDKFVLEATTSYRELKLTNDEYEVVVWKQAEKNKNKYEATPAIKPDQRGRPMGFMPFCIASPTGLDYIVDRPPILDMVNVLAAWWKVSVDHAHAIHTICVPTPAIMADIDEQNFTLKLGPDAVIILPSGADAKFLEFTGQGLSEVTKKLDTLMDMLAALGARLITNTGNKTLVETAEGARIRESMSTAVLGSIIASVESMLQKVCDWSASWVSAEYESSEIKLNKELVSANIDPNMVTALLNAVLANKLSFDSFYRALEEAGLTDPGVSVENEKERISKMVKDAALNPPQAPKPNNQPTS